MAGEGSRTNIVACAVVIGHELIKKTLDSLYPESSDDEIADIIEEANLVEGRLRLGNRGYYEVREQVYVNEIIPRFSDLVFRQHFRMTRTTYENFERRLTPALMQIGKKGRPMIPVRNQLLSVIWLLANPRFVSVSNSFSNNISIKFFNS
ncbi:PREDICTED: uncharacterized protein LOC105557359 [Vollenhovia emeryi]|uniref:uncharacterized protein LOC105557359 n=1 Tax=Vollenhovia emeryi TaxID=411798 RepID=UPI0005F4A9AA|nr:PREDICTED: uncharacterized protein LOC105557359 [Vollenhovia emeryi]